MIIVDKTAYSFDAAWETFLRILPKYANSHYYDIMTYCCGFIAFVFLMLFRRRIKSLSAKIVYRKFGYDIYHRENPNLKALTVYRLINLIIPICAGLLSYFGFHVVADLSRKIMLPTYWTYVALFVPVGIYTVFEFLESGILGWISAIAITAYISYYNYLYCEENADHHKACYAVRITIVTFGIIGIVKQFLPPYKSILRLIWNKIRSKKEVSESTQSE